MRVYYGADADMNLIKSKTAAIIGFGTQRHAHALYPCDSGVRKVVVGLRPSSVGVAKAEAAGLEVVDTAEAPKVADEVMVLTPDELQGHLSRQKLHANMKPAAALAFAHGLNRPFQPAHSPSSIDVFMVAPKAPGHAVRRVDQGAIAIDRAIQIPPTTTHPNVCVDQLRPTCLFVKSCGEPRRADVLRDR
jgi:ketol-acid reductoisomerase